MLDERRAPCVWLQIPVARELYYGERMLYLLQFLRGLVANLVRSRAYCCGERDAETAVDSSLSLRAASDGCCGSGSRWPSPPGSRWRGGRPFAQ
jgi:hypothetical protein